MKKEGDTISVYAFCEGVRRRFEADMVILANAIVPRADSGEVANLLNISTGSDGFFMEAHPKLRPVDTLTEGIFIAGCAQGPKDIPDTVAQASAAASRACSLLSQDHIDIEPVVAVVDERKCIGCGSCLTICPFGAIEMSEIEERMEEVVLKTRKSHVNVALCKGCGACIAECPVGAINQLQFTTKQINAMIHALKS
ncbi:MAG: 4Fe-4S binding protein [Canidatus Methanoxibalbensis ujae]|nr:4Fe-4S binding protein [Candidatus Methanoxibalbensis ujae]